MASGGGWLGAVSRLRAERRPGVLVTVASVRGHAPRDAGAKLVVSSEETWGSVGGGNLEETAVRRARALLADRATAPESLTLTLSDKERAEHGRQCCGGEVTLLLEPLPVVPAVAIFGLGHVGIELARILSRHDLDLWLVDSRPERVPRVGGFETLAGLAPQPPGGTTWGWLEDAVARVETRQAIVPELVLGEVPSGTDVLVLTHDHAEDFALCDAALRCGHLGSVGLIGSEVKWKRFTRNLLAEGHAPEAIERIRTPIGIPAITGKDPATIAVAVAAELLARWSAAATATTEPEQAPDQEPEQTTARQESR